MRLLGLGVLTQRVHMRSCAPSRGLDVTGFLNSLYQWAATLTSSGQNMPFALPIKTDKLEEGFQVNVQQIRHVPEIGKCQRSSTAKNTLQMSLLRIKDGTPVSVGDIVGSVESVQDKV